MELYCVQCDTYTLVTHTYTLTRQKYQNDNVGKKWIQRDDDTINFIINFWFTTYLDRLSHRWRTFRRCERICRTLCLDAHCTPKCFSSHLFIESKTKWKLNKNEYKCGNSVNSDWNKLIVDETSQIVPQMKNTHRHTLFETLKVFDESHTHITYTRDFSIVDANGCWNAEEKWKKKKNVSDLPVSNFSS